MNNDNMCLIYLIKISEICHIILIIIQKSSILFSLIFFKSLSSIRLLLKNYYVSKKNSNIFAIENGRFSVA